MVPTTKRSLTQPIGARGLGASLNSFARASVSRYAKRCASWAVPALGLVLIPKCPFCLAAYVAMGTGLGLSLGEATVIRAGLIGVCVLVLFVVALRQVHPVLRKWAAR